MDREYELGIVNAGVPQAGLEPAFRSLQEMDGTDFDPVAAGITIAELVDGGSGGHGDYKIVVPDTVTERLTGWIDGDPTGLVLTEDSDRYIKVSLDVDDFGMTDLIDYHIKGSRVLDPDTDKLTFLRRDGVTLLVRFDGTRILTPVGVYIGRAPE